MQGRITTARAEDLLSWYDLQARDLPWRIGPEDSKAGVLPDPYRVWLSEIMLQQTTVRAVESYFRHFTERWPDVHALAAASRDEILAAWAGLGYYARARNLHACAERIVQDHGGRFPRDEKTLLTMPGIGPYTAAAIAAIAFGQVSVVVDGNVERVMARLFAEETPLPRAKPLLREYAAQLTPEARPGDYAQAVMDLGATICTPARPDCAACPWRQGCLAHAKGLVGGLPRREARSPKPVRHGIAWIVLDGRGFLLTERRADEGLLGGMLAVPATPWVEVLNGGAAIAPDASSLEATFHHPPLDGNWRSIGEVRHVFTHFHLKLEVRLLRLDGEGHAKYTAEFQPAAQAIAAMPTVFAKAVRLALGAAVEEDAA